MKKMLLVLPLFVLLLIQTQAQEEITYSIPRLRMGIEAGVNLLLGEINNPQMIRENQSYYYDGDYDYHCGFVPKGNGNFGSYTFGLRVEYVLKKRLAIASGLRFSFYNANLSSDRDYFLWRVTEDETITNYVKIKNIHQRNYYLGVPIEIKFFPREKDYFVRHYFIFGTSFNFLVASEKNIEFHNKMMEKYSPMVEKHVGKPSFFNGTVYAGIGLKIGKSSYPFGNIDFFFPVLTFHQHNNNSFTTIYPFGFGVRTTFHIPLHKKHQLTYTVQD